MTKENKLFVQDKSVIRLVLKKSVRIVRIVT